MILKFRLRKIRQNFRREVLEAAEYSGLLAGLPPLSAFAKDLGELWIRGEVTADDAIASIKEHYSRVAHQI